MQPRESVSLASKHSTGKVDLGPGAGDDVVRSISRSRSKPSNLPEGFTEFISGVIRGNLPPLWGNSTFYLRVRRLPGGSLKPSFGLILDLDLDR